MATWDRIEDDFGHLRYFVATAFSLGGLVPLCGLALDQGRPAAPLVVPFVLLWQVGLWRTTLVGVYVGDRGIKIRSVFRTHVVPWVRVARVWAGPATDHDAWQIWVTTQNPERDIATPIWRRGSPAIQRKRIGLLSNRIALSPERFSALLAALDPSR
jgi:hypothetical protein